MEQEEDAKLPSAQKQTKSNHTQGQNWSNVCQLSWSKNGRKNEGLRSTTATGSALENSRPSYPKKTQGVLF